MLIFASLVIFDGVHLLLSTQLTVDLTPEWSDGSIFNYLSNIYAETHFCCVEIVANNTESWTRCCCWSTVSKRATHFQESFLIDECSCKMMSTLPSDTFNSSTISRNFNLRSAKNEFVEQLLNLGDLSVQHPLCLYDRILSQHTASEPLFPTEQRLTNGYQAIALLDQSFPPSESNALSTHKSQMSPLFWKFETVANKFLYYYNICS